MSSLIHWDPFRELEEITSRLSQLSGGGRDLARLESGTRESMKVADWRPLVDIEETPEDYVIKAELPEVKKDDVKISLQEGVLTIEGERSRQKEIKDRKVHRIERSYGNFVRTFIVPEDVEPAGIRADFKDGMLQVKLHKSEQAKPKSIEIKVD